MSRAAVFVDAGYLFAEGSVLLTGARQDRVRLSLDVEGVVAALRREVEKSTGCSLLRIYWYDASRSSLPGPEHVGLAEAQNVKLRLGRINEGGEQKGVDALIMADLVELSRNRAITDAMLLSGDEDLRHAVAQSQQLGVRVHLLGIRQVMRANRSRLLVQEADTHGEWDGQEMAGFLGLTGAAPVAAEDAAMEDTIEQQVGRMVQDLPPDELAKLRFSFAASSTLPPDYDRDVLRIGRVCLGTDILTTPDKSRLRETFRRLVQAGA